MQIAIEALYKSDNSITFGWKPEPGDVVSYKVYVAQVAVGTSMVEVVSFVSNQVSHKPAHIGKVAVDVPIEDVRTALGLTATSNFGNQLLYWTLTTVDSAGVESAIADSIYVEIPPVGVMGKTMKEDPTTNRHIYGFSEGLQKWTKAASSESGALITDANGFWRANTITEYTYDGTNVLTEKWYLSDRTSAGSPAKLITYEYSGSDVIKVTVSDSTV